MRAVRATAKTALLEAHRSKSLPEISGRLFAVGKVRLWGCAAGLSGRQAGLRSFYVFFRFVAVFHRPQACSQAAAEP